MHVNTWKIEKNTIKIIKRKSRFSYIHLENLGEYHHLYVQCDIILLIDVFKNF